MRLAQQRALALTALFQPRTTVLELAGRFPFARRLHKQTECGAGVRHNPVIGAENPADLGRLDVDVHKLAALGVHLNRARVTVGPAVADTQYEIGRQHCRIAVAVAGLQTDHPDH